MGTTLFYDNTKKSRKCLKFSSNSTVLQTGATVPDGFYKYLTFSDNKKMCFYFDNSATDKDWSEHEINCN